MKNNNRIYLLVFTNLVSIIVLIKVASFDKMLSYTDKGELSITPLQYVIFPIVSIIISSYFLLNKRDK